MANGEVQENLNFSLHDSRVFAILRALSGKQEKITKPYNVHKGMSKKKQNAVLGEIVVKNFDRNRLREHRLNQAVC